MTPFLLQQNLAYRPKDSLCMAHEKIETHTLYKTHNKSDKSLEQTSLGRCAKLPHLEMDDTRKVRGKADFSILPCSLD